MLSTHKITVNVTQGHIDAGVKKFCTMCPVAHAICDTLNIKRTFWGCENPAVSVGPNYVSLFYLNPSDENSTPRANLPDSARQFITDFDTGKTVIPFSFELEVPV